MSTDQRFTRLRDILAEVSDLRSTASILAWDQETYMPPDGGNDRARQLATIRKLEHERFTSEETGHLLDALTEPASTLDPLSLEASLVRVVRRDFDKATNLSTDLVTRLAEATSRSQEAWKIARETDRFAEFAPHLERLVDLQIEKAEAYGYVDRVYDPLLDDYEPGMSTDTVESLFLDLRRELVPMVEAISKSPPIEDTPLHQHFDAGVQWAFGLDVIRDFGYDFNRGRQDASIHPFTMAFSISDVRITTHISEQYLPAGLFSTLHEAGHALYEQGIDPALNRTTLADGASLGMHESQSRLWENLIGRSRPFWQRYYPRLQGLFPKQLANLPLESFYRAINRVQAGPIRVNADEVTYNLHVMLRFEIERALLESRVSIRDLPDLWKTTMEDYLGVTPRNDREGVLQDIHWSMGAFGYFPTYTLGNLMATQLFERARRDLPGMDERIARGSFRELLGWLREHVHRYGRTLKTPALLLKATGSTLSTGSWLAYVRERYGQLYPEIAQETAPKTARQREPHT